MGVLLRHLASPREGVDGVLRALAVSPRLSENTVRALLDTVLLPWVREPRVARGIAEMALRAQRRSKRANDHGLVHASFDWLAPALDGAEDAFDTPDVADPAWRAYVARAPDCDYCRHAGARKAGASVAAALVRAGERGERATGERAAAEAAVGRCLMARRRSWLAQLAALHVAAQHPLPGGARALARLAILRPELGKTPLMLRARLRQDPGLLEDPSRIDAPAAAPFEALGPALLDPAIAEALRPMLATFEPTTRVGPTERWSPPPWEAAWWRRNASPRLRDALLQIASRSSTSSAALESLAILGDVERVKAVQDAAEARTKRSGKSAGKRGARARDERDARSTGAAPIPPPLGHQRWSTISDCLTVARGVREQVEAEARGRIPQALTTTDVIDFPLARLALRSVRGDEGAPRSKDDREAAFRVLEPWSDFDEKDRLIATLAERGDAASLERCLVDRNARAPMMAPEHVLAVWRVESEAVRSALATALARISRDDWAARLEACERLADRTSVDVSGLFEAWGKALMEKEGGASAAVEISSLDRLRTLVRIAVNEVAPERALSFYVQLNDELSAALFLRAMERVPRDRAAALRDAVGKTRFWEGRGTARKAWILATRLNSKRSSSRSRG